MFSAKKNSLTNKFIPIQSLADSRQQTADIIEETLSSAVDSSGAGRPAAHSFGRECAAGLFSFKSVFRSSSRQCAGWK